MKNEKQTQNQKRNYSLQPRRIGEIDPDYRDDLGDFPPSLTKQADKDACDINLIMERFTQTGQLPSMMEKEPMYGDFSDVASFQEALEIVAHANAQFYALDARVRQRFENDPAKMLEFVEQSALDPEKRQVLVDLGLAIPKAQPAEPVKEPAKADSAVSK